MPTKKKTIKQPSVSMIGMLPTPSPQWYEMLDWNEMGDTWWGLKEEMRQKIRDSGNAPKYDREDKNEKST